MTLDIPYTFTPGTKAKANEVNENFLAVKNSFDENEDLLEEAQTDILNLNINKANITGSIENRFQVADAINSYDAINKQTFNKFTANTNDYIQGYQLSKFDNNTITAQPGSCYDSTHTEILTSNSALTATQSNLSANATYYVYVTGGGTASITLVISLSNATPELPVGATVYRQVGHFITDSDGYISGINSLSDSEKVYPGPFVTTDNFIIGSNISVSTILPNDGYVYLVWLHRHIGGSGSGGDNYVGSDIFPTKLVNKLDGDAGRYSNTVCLITIPVGIGRTITATGGVTICGYLKLYPAGGV